MNLTEYILHGYVHGVSSLPLKQHFADLIMTRLIDILWHWLTSRDQIWLISGLDSGRYIGRGGEGVTWVWLEFHDEFWQQMRVVVLYVEAGQVHTLVPGGYWHYLDNLGQIICEIAGQHRENIRLITWVPTLAPPCLLLMVLLLLWPGWPPLPGPRSGISGRMDSVMVETRHGSSSCSNVSLWNLVNL